MKEIVYVKPIAFPDEHSGTVLELEKIYKCVYVGVQGKWSYMLSGDQRKDSSSDTIYTHCLENKCPWATWEEVTEEEWLEQEGKVNKKTYFLAFDYYHYTDLSFNKFYYGVSPIDLNECPLSRFASNIIQEKHPDVKIEEIIIKITALNNVEI